MEVQTDRRQFLKRFTAITLGSASFNIPAHGSMLKSESQYDLDKIIKCIEENEMGIDRKQINNLEYAYERIKPSSHQEMAFVVSFGESYPSLVHVVDEYVRRKNGSKPQLPDHKVFSLEGHFSLYPDTQRILMFSEQNKAAISAMMSFRNSFELMETYRDFNLRSVSYNKFVRILSRQFLKKRKSHQEIRDIYDALCLYVPISTEYVRCSAIVTKALTFTETQECRCVEK